MHLWKAFFLRWGVLPTMVLCIPLALGSVLCPTMTYVYTSPYVNLSDHLALGVDGFLFYPPLNATDNNKTFELFDTLRGPHGKAVYLVIGKDVNKSWTSEKAYEDASSLVDDFGKHIDGCVFWDDPLRKGGAAVRNEVARRIRQEHPETRLGVCLDLSKSRVEAVAENPNADILQSLNLSLYDFLVAYYYTWINSTYWIRTPSWRVNEYQGTVDTGALFWLKTAIHYAVHLGEEYGLEVWFTHNAHSVYEMTVTKSQMEEDLKLSKRAGIKHIGWFTMDKIKTRDQVVYFGSANAGFDASIRYNYLRTILVDQAEEPLSQELGHQHHLAMIAILILAFLVCPRQRGEQTASPRALQRAR